MANSFKKLKVVFVGNKCHKELENVFTLSRSNLDEYDGILEMLFYYVIDKEPIEYFNCVELSDDFTEEDIDECQYAFVSYRDKIKLSPTIQSELDELITYIRREALKDERIEVKNGILFPIDNLYTMKYVRDKMLKFYKEKVKENARKTKIEN